MAHFKTPTFQKEVAIEDLVLPDGATVASELEQMRIYSKDALIESKDQLMKSIKAAINRNDVGNEDGLEWMRKAWSPERREKWNELPANERGEYKPVSLWLHIPHGCCVLEY